MEKHWTEEAGVSILSPWSNRSIFTSRQGWMGVAGLWVTQLAAQVSGGQAGHLAGAGATPAAALLWPPHLGGSGLSHQPPAEGQLPCLPCLLCLRISPFESWH